MKPDIQYFAESGTWVRPPGAVRTDVLLVPAGSGGSFGKDGSNGEVRRWSMPAPGEELPETVEVIIGKGGRGVDGGGDGADGCALFVTHLAGSACSDDSGYQVALWYMRYHSPDYGLFETEERAAGQAAFMEEDGGASPLGAQFADGRVVRCEDWPAYAEARQRQEDSYRRSVAEMEARKPPPVRKARDPFEGRAIEIELSEPAWLGASSEAAPQ